MSSGSGSSCSSKSRPCSPAWAGLRSSRPLPLIAATPTSGQCSCAFRTLGPSRDASQRPATARRCPASGGTPEVLGRDVVEELAELLHLVLLLVRDRDASLVED